MTVEQADIMIQLLTNLNQGIHTVLWILGAFFVWQVVKIFYNLFAGVFFGGL